MNTAKCFVSLNFTGLNLFYNFFLSGTLLNENFAFILATFCSLKCFCFLHNRPNFYRKFVQIVNFCCFFLDSPTSSFRHSGLNSFYSFILSETLSLGTLLLLWQLFDHLNAFVFYMISLTSFFLKILKHFKHAF